MICLRFLVEMKQRLLIQLNPMVESYEELMSKAKQSNGYLFLAIKNVTILEHLHFIQKLIEISVNE